MKHGDIINGLMLSIDREEFSMSDLLYLCKPFSITETNIRTYLSRNIQNNLFSVRRAGKKAYYKVGNKMSRISSNTARSFNPLEWLDWDNSWWGFSFSVPEIERALRYKYRKKLSAYRFGRLNGGFWIRPYAKSENIDAVFESYRKSKYCRLIRFNYWDSFSKNDAAEIWNLEEINQGFRIGINEIEDCKKLISRIDPEEALIKRIELGNKIIPKLSSDPLLPEILLPPDWQGKTIRNSFFQCEKELRAKARIYWENCPDDTV